MSIRVVMGCIAASALASASLRHPNPHFVLFLGYGYLALLVLAALKVILRADRAFWLGVLATGIALFLFRVSPSDTSILALRDQMHPSLDSRDMTGVGFVITARILVSIALALAGGFLFAVARRCADSLEHMPEHPAR